MMISALAIVGRAMNLSPVTVAGNTFLSYVGTASRGEFPNINQSRSCFRYDYNSYPAPFFYINRVVGITGGGGGGGTSSPTSPSRAGGGGKAGNVFEIDVKLHFQGGSFLLNGGGGGIGAQNGKIGNNYISPGFGLDSTKLPAGGAGGDAWVGGGVLNSTGEASAMTPYGDGGDGASGLGDGNGFAGNGGTTNYRGLVW